MSFLSYDLRWRVVVKEISRKGFGRSDRKRKSVSLGPKLLLFVNDKK